MIPNLLLYEGSVLAIDPKGELAALTARARAAAGQEVYVIDPFDVSGPDTLPYRSSFNPLDEIDANSETAIDDAALLADALIIQEGGGGNDKHWTDAARELVKLLILDALSQTDAKNRTLAYVRAFFHAPGDFNKKGEPISGHRLRLSEMLDNDEAFDGLVCGLASSFIGKNEGEFNSIVSTAEVQLGFLNSRPLAECL